MEEDEVRVRLCSGLEGSDTNTVGDGSETLKSVGFERISADFARTGLDCTWTGWGNVMAAGADRAGIGSEDDLSV